MLIRNNPDIDIKNKRLLIREDLNVPMKNGQITNDKRLHAVLPTVQQALIQGAAVILMSHLGRPKEGQPDEQYSLAPVAKRLSELLKQSVRFEKDWLEGLDIQPGEVVLVENVRFLKGEKANDSALAEKMAAQCDIFVMDAFATAHRAHASTTGVAKAAKKAYAGPLLLAELEALSKALEKPKKPVVAIVGGAKVSTKLPVLRSLLEKVDVLIVGGGIANTFLLASGYKVGKSLVEDDQLVVAKALLALAEKRGVALPLPTDVRVAKAFSEQASATVKLLADVSDDDMILDVGPKTADSYASLLQQAGTILWNGPVGVFEFPAFAQGTESLAKAIANSKAFSLAGGGDTLAAIDQFGVADKISYISTGGGAFLEFVEGKTLPGVEALIP